MYLSYAEEGKNANPQHSICCVGRKSVRTEFPSIVRPPNPAYFVPPVNARGQAERTQSDQPHHSACSSNPLFKSLFCSPSYSNFLPAALLLFQLVIFPLVFQFPPFQRLHTVASSAALLLLEGMW
ncbi:hypothetical protein P167DRAFT_366966 [Morchella conica CCBAS932]|uniref:Uncharacterized protein n=1 Tax=Morchella conica CCBAS932 TaxID=1392247 RepID=A0A3N4KBZ3_9PEZI|nr:hypothetical protein P167DRAFT_366966 [Morchella conica CCBAS932]